jgi:hypothetical protein
LALVAKSTFGLRSPASAAVQPLPANDALLMPPLQSSDQQDSLEGGLPTSDRNRKPAIRYSPAHARSAALASRYSSPINLSRQLASTVKQHLEQAGGPYPAYAIACFHALSGNGRIAPAPAIRRPTLAELRARLDGLKP